MPIAQRENRAAGADGLMPLVPNGQAAEPTSEPGPTGVLAGPAGGRHRPRRGQGKHNPALDGLRTVAVLAVFFHHMDLLPGGYLGVDLFLVLSGFLITGLLLAEFDRRGAISLKAFWTRRAYRLMPAFYVFVLLGIPLVLIAKSVDDQWQFLRNALSAVLYVANIYRVIEPEEGGAWFGHVWSLSLEEQFYLLWPATLALICRSKKARRHLPEILLVLVVVVVGWREILSFAGVQNSRIYFGPDTRFDSLLVGCLLASWRHEYTRRSAAVAKGLAVDRGGAGVALTDAVGRLLPRIAMLGPVALVSILVLFEVGPDLKGGPNWMAFGGYTLVAVLAAILILTADQGRPTWLNRALSVRPMAWMGRASYSFYLWHFPATGFALSTLVPRFGSLVATGFAFVLGLGLAVGSYYLIEIPAQRHRPKWASGSSLPSAAPRQRDAPAPQTDAVPVG